MVKIVIVTVLMLLEPSSLAIIVNQSMKLLTVRDIVNNNFTSKNTENVSLEICIRTVTSQ